MPFLLVRMYRSVCCPSSVLPNACFCFFDFASACRQHIKMIAVERTRVAAVVSRSLIIHRLLGGTSQLPARAVASTLVNLTQDNLWQTVRARNSANQNLRMYVKKVHALSEARGRCDALALDTLVRLVGREVFVFLSSSA